MHLLSAMFTVPTGSNRRGYQAMSLRRLRLNGYRHGLPIRAAAVRNRFLARYCTLVSARAELPHLSFIQQLRHLIRQVVLYNNLTSAHHGNFSSPPPLGMELKNQVMHS